VDDKTSYKSRAKGVSKHLSKNFTDIDYRDVIHSRRENVMVTTRNILRERFEIYTVEQKKIGLSMGCTKRKWFPDGTSKAYGNYLHDNDPSPFVTVIPQLNNLINF
jgi:hypothetical protein